MFWDVHYSFKINPQATGGYRQLAVSAWKIENFCIGEEVSYLHKGLKMYVWMSEERRVQALVGISGGQKLDQIKLP